MKGACTRNDPKTGPKEGPRFQKKKKLRQAANGGNTGAPQDTSRWKKGKGVAPLETRNRGFLYSKKGKKVIHPGGASETVPRRGGEKGTPGMRQGPSGKKGIFGFSKRSG